MNSNDEEERDCPPASLSRQSPASIYHTRPTTEASIGVRHTYKLWAQALAKNSTTTPGENEGEHQIQVYESNHLNAVFIELIVQHIVRTVSSYFYKLEKKTFVPHTPQEPLLGPVEAN